MKKYWFIIGLSLSLLGAGWLIYIVKKPVPSDRVDSYFAVRAKRADATIAFCLFFAGLALILADAFGRNLRAERLEHEREVLREEIISLLPVAKESQQELNLYIEQLYGRTGLIGLDVEQLNEVKRHINRKIAEGEQRD